MSKIVFDESGEHEAYCTAWTLVIYEQQFHADMIQDVFGRIDMSKSRYELDSKGEVLTVDYTNENWTKNIQALWAMLRTASEIGFMDGDVAANKRIPSYDDWIKTVKAVDSDGIASFVITEMQSGFFRPAATDSGTTSTKDSGQEQA
ncbi:hypothetical protein [Atopobium fossor]|uniref:hypothetical protein n=1 Tax=Atopobium fossor TaxID=39487 RepID=UPI000411F36B|nr:hypothetical protein [Atopobium fossor]